MRIFFICCIAGMAACIAGIVHEVGEYCDELNPYNNKPKDNRCWGCMGGAFNDCEDCDVFKKKK